MTPTQWMGAVILAGAVAFWIYDGFRTAGDKVRAARRSAFDDHVRTAGVVETDWDAEPARLTGGGK